MASGTFARRFLLQNFKELFTLKKAQKILLYRFHYAKLHTFFGLK